MGTKRALTSLIFDTSVVDKRLHAISDFMHEFISLSEVVPLENNRKQPGTVRSMSCGERSWIDSRDSK